jgi:hypothetical protein
MTKLLLALTTAGILLAGNAGWADTNSAEPTTRRQAQETWAEEGLQQIKSGHFDLVYVQPGSVLAGYDKVFIAPISVAFQQNWERSVLRDSGTQLRPEDFDYIKSGLTEIVREQFVLEFGRAGYQVVDSPGEGVLAMELRIAELYINAPDLPTAGIVRKYTRSFGQMTLIAELADSKSGETKMRVLDRSLGRDYGTMRLTTRVENAAEARKVASAWARAMVRDLAAAKH